jgi:capsid portal protein
MNTYLHSRLFELSVASRDMSEQHARSIESAWLQLIIGKAFDVLDDNSRDTMLRIIHDELKTAGYLNQYGNFRIPDRSV